MNSAPALQPASIGTRLAGQVLFNLCDRFPAAKAPLRHLGLRTNGKRFGPRIGTIQFPDGSGFKLASISDNYLSHELFWKGGQYYEPITRLLLQQIVQPGTTFVDVGANIGFYSLVIGTTCPQSRVISFEPNPRNYALLQRNVAVNGLGNVRCEPLAVSDEDTTSTLYLCDSDMSASLVAGFEQARGSVTVHTTSIDSYLARHPVDGSLAFKVDVEGHEEALFRGMENTLATRHPDIITEVTLNYSAAARELMTRHGYRFFQITDRGLIESRELQPVTRGQFVFLNYLITTRTDAEIRSLFRKIAPALDAIDLTQTSKFLPEDRMREFKARARGGVRVEDNAGYATATD